jgi:hypothetical protein
MKKNLLKEINSILKNSNDDNVLSKGLEARRKLIKGVATSFINVKRSFDKRIAGHFPKGFMGRVKEGHKRQDEIWNYLQGNKPISQRGKTLPAFIAFDKVRKERPEIGIIETNKVAQALKIDISELNEELNKNGRKKSKYSNWQQWEIECNKSYLENIPKNIFRENYHGPGDWREIIDYLLFLHEFYSYSPKEIKTLPHVALMMADYSLTDLAISLCSKSSEYLNIGIIKDTSGEKRILGKKLKAEPGHRTVINIFDTRKDEFEGKGRWAIARRIMHAMIEDRARHILGIDPSYYDAIDDKDIKGVVKNLKKRLNFLEKKSKNSSSETVKINNILNKYPILKQNQIVKVLEENKPELFPKKK